ncbi:MAG: isopeptide-forming domain-containing fimbrial protein [Firmicutes bacterium]|nr:isopeptide-forming domain-containing fimbrial protein [Bacillota bacterium]
MTRKTKKSLRLLLVLLIALIMVMSPIAAMAAELGDSTTQEPTHPSDYRDVVSDHAELDSATAPTESDTARHDEPSAQHEFVMSGVMPLNAPAFCNCPNPGNAPSVTTTWGRDGFPPNNPFPGDLVWICDPLYNDPNFTGTNRDITVHWPATPGFALHVLHFYCNAGWSMWTANLLVGQLERIPDGGFYKAVIPSIHTSRHIDVIRARVASVDIEMRDLHLNYTPAYDAPPAHVLDPNNRTNAFFGAYDYAIPTFTHNVYLRNRTIVHVPPLPPEHLSITPITLRLPIGGDFEFVKYVAGIWQSIGYEYTTDAMDPYSTPGSLFDGIDIRPKPGLSAGEHQVLVRVYQYGMQWNDATDEWQIGNVWLGGIRVPGTDYIVDRPENGQFLVRFEVDPWPLGIYKYADYENNEVNLYGVEIRDIVTYTVVIQNNNDAEAVPGYTVVGDDLDLRYVLPVTPFSLYATIFYADDTVHTPYPYSTPPATHTMSSTGELRIFIASIPAGGSAVVHFDVEIREAAAGRTITNRAWIVNGDPDQYAEANVEVLEPPPIILEKEATPDTVEVGDTITYTITARHPGESVSAQRVPAGLIIGDDIDLRLVSWNLGSLTVTVFDENGNVFATPLPNYVIGLRGTAAAPIGELRVTLPYINPDHFVEIQFSVTALPAAATNPLPNPPGGYGVRNVAFIVDEDGTPHTPTPPVDVEVTPVPYSHGVLFYANPPEGGTVDGAPIHTRVVREGDPVGVVPVVEANPGWEPYYQTHWCTVTLVYVETPWTHNGNPISPAEIEEMIVTGAVDLEFAANFRPVLAHLSKEAGYINDYGEFVPVANHSVEVGVRFAYRLRVTNNHATVAIPAGKVVGDDINLYLVDFVQGSVRINGVPAVRNAAPGYTFGGVLPLVQQFSIPGLIGQLRVSLPAIPAGEYVDIMFEVIGREAALENEIAPGIYGVRNVAFTVNNDGTPGTPTPPIDVEITPRDTPTITKSVAAQAVVGTTVTYTLIVNNPNDVTLYRPFTIVDQLAPYLTFVNNTISIYDAQGNAFNWNTDYMGGINNNELWITLNRLPAGNTTITFNVTVNAKPATPIYVYGEYVYRIPNIARLYDNMEEIDRGDAYFDVVDAIPPQTEVTITKTASAPTIEINTEFTYTITVTNTSTETEAIDLVVTDQLPSQVTFVRSTSNLAGVNFEHNDRVLTANISRLFPGQSVTFLVTVTADEIADSVVNSAVVAPGPNGNFQQPPPAVAEVEITDVPQTTVTIVKTASVANVQVHHQFTYTITVRNTGTAPATDVIVTDQLPSQVSYVSSVSNLYGVYFTHYNGVLTATVPTLFVGQILTFTVTVTADEVANNVINNAIVAPGPNGNFPEPPPARVPVNITETPPPPQTTVTIEKTASVAQVQVGNEFYYTITVRNTGDVPAINVTVNDQLPNEVSFVSTVSNTTGVGLAHDNGALTATIPEMFPGQIIIFTVRVTADVVANNVINNAVVRGGENSNFPDPPPAQVPVDITETPLPPQTTVTIEKTASVEEVVVGNQFYYTITVTNTGNVNATNVVVTDQLPSEVSFVSSTSNLAGVNFSHAYGELTTTIPTLHVNQSVTFVVRVTADEVADNVRNNAVVRRGENSNFPEPQPDYAEVDIIPPPQTTVEIQKFAPLTVQTGTNFTYTLIVRNTGDVPAHNLVITDTLPTGVTFVSVSPNATYNNGVITATLGILAPGDTIVILVTVLAGEPTLPGYPVENTATVTGGNFPPDEDYVPVDIVGPPQTTVTIAKHAPNQVHSGAEFYYIIVATNTGGVAATNVVITDVLPLGVEFVSVSPNATFDSATRTVTATVASLAPGEVVYITVRVEAGPPTLPGYPVENTATVTGDNFPDDDDDEEVIITIDPDELYPVIEITKTAPETVVSGMEFMYTIVVVNRGTAAATNVVIIDELPLGVEFYSVSPNATFDAATRTVTADIGYLAPGEVVVIYVTVTAGPPTDEPVVNRARITGDNFPPDDCYTPVIIIGPEITIEKTAPSPIVAGTEFRYTIVVSNTGDGPALDLVITDELPAGVTFVSVSDNASHANGIITAILDILVPGDVIVIEVTVIADPVTEPTTIENTAVVTGGNFPPDDCYVPVEIVPPDPTDTIVTIVKTASSQQVTVGSNFTYTIRVTNTGSVLATGVEVIDVLPAGVTFVSVSANATFDPATRTVTADIGDLAPGEVVTITVTVTANTVGQVMNTARVTGDNFPPGDDGTRVDINPPWQQPPWEPPPWQPPPEDPIVMPPPPDGIPWSPWVPERPPQPPTDVYYLDYPTEEPPTEPTFDHINPVHYAYMIGYREDGTIRPQANMTRAEATTIFFRLISDQHRATIWSQTNSFVDVQPERWFNNAVSTMQRGGLFAGIPFGIEFRPNQAVTRAEFAAMIVNYLGLGNATATNSTFTDTEGHWAHNAINVAYRQGWINGFGDGTFRPDDLITRAQVAALVNRALGRLPEFTTDLLPNMVRWPDNMNENAWYFLYIQEATNSHFHEMKDCGVHETWTELITPRNWRLLERPYSTPNVFTGLHIGGDAGSN